MFIGGYYLARRFLIGFAVLLLVIGAGLAYLLSSGSSDQSTLAGPGATTVAAPVETTMTGTPATGPEAATATGTPASSGRQAPAPFQAQPFKPRRLPGPPPKPLQQQAARLFAQAERLNTAPKGNYWLGPRFRGLEPYHLPSSGSEQSIIYTTAARFPQADAVYVTTYDASSSLIKPLLTALAERLVSANGGRYAVLGMGTILFVSSGKAVRVTAIGHSLEGLTPKALAAALRPA